MIFFKQAAITSQDIAVFLRQFSTLLSANIPLLKSCEMMEKSQNKPAMRLLIYTIKRDILTGNNLLSCLNQHPQHFDTLICQLIHIGEHTGRLDKMLTISADYQENTLAFKRKIQQALFYPCVIFSMAIMMTVGMFIFIIPHFATLFKEANLPLPLLTQAIFYLSTLLREYAWKCLLILVITLLFILRSRFTTTIISTIQTYTYSLPIIKHYRHTISLARLSRHLAITLAAGLPITQALSISGQQKPTIAKILSHLQAGQQLYAAMAVHTEFPPLMIQMIKIGEESGTLDAMLAKLADFFDADIDQLTTRIGQLLEPLIMVVLGALIGGLVIGLYLPIFTLGSAL
jgi:type IV pilus assembly protein PilC